LLRPGLGFPGDDFAWSKRAASIRAACNSPSGAERNRLVDFLGRVAGGLNRNQQIDVYQRLSAALMPRGGKKAASQQQPAAGNVAHLGELELLPIHTKTELGDSLAKNVKAGHFSGSDLWCLSRFARASCSTAPSTR